MNCQNWFINFVLYKVKQTKKNLQKLYKFLLFTPSAMQRAKKRSSLKEDDSAL